MINQPMQPAVSQPMTFSDYLKKQIWYHGCRELIVTTMLDEHGQIRFCVVPANGTGPAGRFIAYGERVDADPQFVPYAGEPR